MVSSNDWIAGAGALSPPRIRESGLKLRSEAGVVGSSSSCGHPHSVEIGFLVYIAAVPSARPQQQGWVLDV